MELKVNSIPDLSNEFRIKTSRSGGKGGQHVNKVETRVEIRWTPGQSEVLPPEILQRILQELQHQLNKEGDLIVVSSEARTQLENKQLATKKLYRILQKCLHEKRERKATRIPKHIHTERLNHKKKIGQTKSLRKKVNPHNTTE